MSLSFSPYTSGLFTNRFKLKPDQLEITDLTITLSHYLYEVLLEPGRGQMRDSIKWVNTMFSLICEIHFIDRRKHIVLSEVNSVMT